MIDREASVGWCCDCASLEHLKDERCYDCWHEWCESQPCWKVFRLGRDGYADHELYCAYLEHEARAFAAELKKRNEAHGSEYEARPVRFWSGERVGHPGYMKRRVQQIVSSYDPETAAKWKASMGACIRWWT